MTAIRLTSQSGVCQQHTHSHLLQKIFNTLIDSFIDNKVGLAENFLSTELAAHLKENLVALFAKKNYARPEPGMIAWWYMISYSGVM